MTVQTVTVYDATRDNISHLPGGQQAAGYATGSGGVPWAPADWAAHPGAVRIDQDPAASDTTADILDVEAGAATIGSCAAWAARAALSHQAATRPGQRKPAIYASRSNITPICNALAAGGVISGVGLWIADWSLTPEQAAAEVAAASGPYPVIGVQYRNAGAYDISVFSRAWLDAVSAPLPPKPPAPAAPPAPPGPWNDPHTWNWTDVVTGGIGLDGKFHLFHLENDAWVKIR
jgi:hypothetical protein